MCPQAFPADFPQFLPQAALRRALHAAIGRDEHIAAALTYGSFTQGEADAYSDIEYFLFCADPAGFDLRAFLDAVAPVRLWLTNEFGTPNAIFDGLIRGEFHVESLSAMDQIARWPERRVNVDAMLVKDPGGQLRAHLQALRERGRAAPHTGTEVQVLWDRLLNWLIFGSAVLLRGERARALELLWWAHDLLVRLARLSEGALQHWLSAKRWLEAELGPLSLARFAACTGGLPDLERAYQESWTWGRELLAALQTRYPVDGREDITTMLDERFRGLRA